MSHSIWSLGSSARGPRIGHGPDAMRRDSKRRGRGEDSIYWVSYDIEHSSLSINVARLGSSVTTVSVTESSSWPVSIDSWPLRAIARIR